MNPNPVILTRSGIIFYGLLFVVALIVAKMAGVLDQWLPQGGLPWFVQILGGSFVGMTGVWLSRFTEARVLAVRQLALDFSQLLRGLSRGQAWILALVSGIAEEALFRGTLQPLLGLLPTTVLFAVVHVGPSRRYLWWTASALLYGLVLGLLFEWGMGLLAPVAAHVTLNAVNLYNLAQRPVMPRMWAE